jgi:antitoxin HicB
MEGTSDMDHYSMQLIWSDEKGGYMATVPELPEISVLRETAEAAVAAVYEAVSAYLAEKETSRSLVSAPRCLEAYSGQFRLRVPRVLHSALVQEAESEGISLNTYILYLLSRRHEQNRPAARTEAVVESRLMETIQYMNEWVSNVTVAGGAYPGFSWHNDTSITITQIQ